MKKYYFIFTLLFLGIGIIGGIFIGKAFSPAIPAVEAENKADKNNKVALSIDSLNLPDKNLISDSDFDDEFGVDITIIDKCLGMLKEEFLNEIDMRKVATGAISGMRERLKSLKIDPKEVKDIPSSVPEKEIINTLQKRYEYIISKYGNKDEEAEDLYKYFNKVITEYSKEFGNQLKDKPSSEIIDDLIERSNRMDFLIKFMSEAFSYINFYYIKFRKCPKLERSALTIYRE